MIELCEVRKEQFIIFCKIRENHFIRKRKMPLNTLLLSVIARKGKTLVMEIRSFFKELNQSDRSISKAGYSKQRQKLNPRALLHLSDLRAKNFYKDRQMVQRLKGYLVFASDGTDINLPNTKENYQAYGSSSRKNTKLQASLSLVCMFDVLNKMIVGLSLHKCKADERESALQQMEHAEELANTQKVIYLFDRGYPSGEMFLDLENQEKKFIIRLSSTSFKREQRAMTKDDEMTTITFTRERINAHKTKRNYKVAEKLEAAQKITLRFVRIHLSDSKVAYFATNLEQNEFTSEEIAFLYHLRWEIETAFDVLKNKLQLENFTGTKPITIEQDIYASVYICNIMHDMTREAQLEREAKSNNEYKYQMAINKNIAVGLIKESIISFVITNSLIKKGLLMKKILKEIESHIEPVREERHYKRTKGKLASKYSNVNKRAY